MLKTRFFYHMEDVVNSNTPLELPALTFSAFLNLMNNSETTWPEDITEPVESATLWKEYIWYSYHNCNLFYVDVEHEIWEEIEDPKDSDDYNYKKQSWIALCIRWIIETSERYVPLIRNYQAIKENLMETINSESLVLYNDTPQAAGDWTADPYTTNATKTSSKQEVATPIERLNEIDRKLKSLYGEWANEFSKLVIMR